MPPPSNDPLEPRCRSPRYVIGERDAALIMQVSQVDYHVAGLGLGAVNGVADEPERMVRDQSGPGVLELDRCALSSRGPADRRISGTPSAGVARNPPNVVALGRQVLGEAELSFAPEEPSVQYGSRARPPLHPPGGRRISTGRRVVPPSVFRRSSAAYAAG